MSLKNKVRLTITKNESISKIYNKYHEVAKYAYADRSKRVIVNDKVEIIKIGNDKTNFFGYYDKCCVYENKAIYHQVNSKSLALNQEIDIVCDGEIISHTNTWNWQQGCMLSWIDENRIIHNFYDNGYKSKIINLATKKETIIDFPIYSNFKNGEKALSLNFNRLA